MSLHRRVKALEAAHRGREPMMVLAWYEGEPKPQKPEGFAGLFVTIRKPIPRPEANGAHP